MRLSPLARWCFYSVSALLLISGVVWVAVDWTRNPETEPAATILAWCLKVHGGAAMPGLLVLGALIPTHLYRSWRSRRNRLSGLVLVGVAAVLIITAYGLYYAADDTWHRYIALSHIWLGLASPLLLIAHMLLGRRTRPVKGGRTGGEGSVTARSLAAIAREGQDASI